MKTIGTRQREWAQFKYLILAKSQSDYLAIRKLFANNEWNDTKDRLFVQTIHHALAQPTSKGNLLNAYQHIWGYFKKKATPAERQTYHALNDSFSLEADQLYPFLRAMTLKYQEAYLLQCRLLFPRDEQLK
ncbi:DUF1722 domain-containing protein [Erwinia sp. CPCC 100877]|nr:DUF1722 domain-containing protein [Erwinia sp. CPCC 100877]